MGPDSAPRMSAAAAKPRVLLVKLKHIGDALLLTPTIAAIRESYPDSEITVVVRRGTQGILAGCRGIDHLLTVAPVDSRDRSLRDVWADIRTLFWIRGHGFDYAFELTDGDRGRLLTGMSRARQRCANISVYPLSRWWGRWFNGKSESAWRNLHRVEKDHLAVSDFLPLSGGIPSLQFERSAAKVPEFIRGLGDYAVIHPGTRWPRKQWPVEHWIKVGNELLNRVSKLVISSGPDLEERELAGELVAALGKDRVISTDGQCDWSGLAGTLYGARLFVGVDTAAMHLAAACQCPIVAIFGDSVVSQWSPWKAPCALVHPREFMSEEEARSIPSREIIKRITPDMVVSRLDELLRKDPAVDAG